MQKLLIVIAIQFCLPLLAYGIELSVPLAWQWSLDTLTVFINTVCVGSMIGLLRPRWKWMLLASGLLICYWAIWQEVYFSKWRDVWVNVDFDIRWYYLKFLFYLAFVSVVLGSLLSYFFKLSFKSGDTRTQLLLFSLSDLLCFTALIALLVVTASIRFQSTDIFENFLGLFEHIDTVWLIAALTIFYQLLWQPLSWKRFSLAVCLVAIFLMAMVPVPTEAELMGINKQDFLVSRFSFLYLAIVTVVLYRAAGVRIDWRWSEPLPTAAQPTGPH